MSAPSPGWYPDPTTPGSLRFYDGDQWTKSVVTVPANGQLTPDMIATGRKIMQDKASAKLADGPITPRALGSNGGAVGSAGGGVGAAGANSAANEPQTRSSRNALSSASAVSSRSALSSASALSSGSALSAASAASAGASTTRSDRSQAGTPQAETRAESRFETRAQRFAARAAASETGVSETAAPESTTAEPVRYSEPTRTAPTPAVSAAQERTDDTAQWAAAGTSIAATGSSVASAPAAHSDSAQNSNSSQHSSESADVSTTTPKWATDEAQNDDNSAFANDVAAGAKSPATAASKKRFAIILIVAVVLIVAIVAAIWFSLRSNKDTSAGAPSKAYQSLGLKDDFGCEQIASEVKELSRSGNNEIPVISLKDIKMTNDKRDTFELPTQSGKYTTAFECEGLASYDDGETQQLTFDMSADKSGKLWTYYSPRTK